MVLAAMVCRLPFWKTGNEIASASLLRYSDGMMDALTFYAREPLQELSRLTSALDEKQTLSTAEKENIRSWLLEQNMKKEDVDTLLVCAAIEVEYEDMYEPLELHEVKEQVAKHASFSLGKQLIRQMMPRFDALWVRRELARVKEAYALVVRFGNMPFGGIHDTRDSIEAAMKGHDTDTA